MQTYAHGGAQLDTGKLPHPTSHPPRHPTHTLTPRTCTGAQVLNTGPSAASCGTPRSSSAYSSACGSGAEADSPAATAAARPCGAGYGGDVAGRWRRSGQAA